MSTGITFGTAAGNKLLTEPYVGTASGNKLVTEIWVGTASGNKLVYGDFTPNAVNWADISAATAGSNANQTITGITSSITLTWSQTGGGVIRYSKNGGAFTTGTSVSMSAGDTLRFEASKVVTPVSGSVTVRNASDGDTVLDTFNYNIT